jgi:hypothetical protein
LLSKYSLHYRLEMRDTGLTVCDRVRLAWAGGPSIDLGGFLVPFLFFFACVLLLFIFKDLF